MGRGVETFSISSAIAFASYTPTQMGSTVLPLMSLRITIGMLFTGSIMSPRIFISTSIIFLRPPTQSDYTTNALSPTKEVGPERVTRTGR